MLGRSADSSDGHTRLPESSHYRLNFRDCSPRSKGVKPSDGPQVGQPPPTPHHPGLSIHPESRRLPSHPFRTSGPRRPRTGLLELGILGPPPRTRVPPSQLGPGSLSCPRSSVPRPGFGVPRPSPGDSPPRNGTPRTGHGGPTSCRHGPVGPRLGLEAPPTGYGSPRNPAQDQETPAPDLGALGVPARVRVRAPPSPRWNSVSGKRHASYSRPKAAWNAQARCESAFASSQSRCWCALSRYRFETGYVKDLLLPCPESGSKTHS